MMVTGASGGVGLAAVQLATARGCRVVAQTSESKADLVRSAGADDIVDREASDLAERVPNGLDAVVDVVAGPGLDALLPCLRTGGRWIVAGSVAGPVVKLDVRRLYLHNLQLIGSTMHTPAHFAALAEQAQAGGFKPRIAKRYPLEAIHDAHAALARRSHVGKIVVVPGLDV